VTGDAFDKIRASGSPDFFLKHVAIFARMKPHQKEACVLAMQWGDRVVGMCGDGANDCAALSVAQCGIALSDAEASLVAPFAARDLSCVSTADVVREGRSCLANAFSTFKYTIFYSLLQTMQMVFAFSFHADFSQAMYVFEDFLVYIPMSFFMVKSRASKKLKGVPPTSRVFGPSTLGSLFGQLAITCLVSFGALVLLHRQSWYFPEQDPAIAASRKEAGIPRAEVTTVFFVGSFLYITAGLAFTFGGRWREPFYLNFGLLGTCLITYTAAILVLFVSYYSTRFATLFHFEHVPISWRGILFGISVSGSIIMVLWEKFVVLGELGDLIKQCLGSPTRDYVQNEDDGEELEFLN